MYLSIRSLSASFAIRLLGMYILNEQFKSSRDRIHEFYLPKLTCRTLGGVLAPVITDTIQEPIRRLDSTRARIGCVRGANVTYAPFGIA
jgi:hypothetical protein